MKDHQIHELVNQLRDIAIKYHAAGQLREQIARTLRAAMLQAGNSPVIPDGSEQRIAEAVELLKRAAPAMLADDSGPNGPLVGRLKSQAIPAGYVMVPKEPTKEMIDAGWLHFMGTKNPSSKGTYEAMLAAAQQEAK